MRDRFRSVLMDHLSWIEDPDLDWNIARLADCLVDAVATLDEGNTP